eukprot:14974538-Alexandrium_andersonii.AAC.1
MPKAFAPPPVRLAQPPPMRITGQSALACSRFPSRARPSMARSRLACSGPRSLCSSKTSPQRWQG